MASLRELCRGHRRLRPLVEFALREGWEVSRTSDGSLTFVKPGLPPICSAAAASDRRAGLNARAQLRPAAPQRTGTGDRDG